MNLTKKRHMKKIKRIKTSTKKLKRLEMLSCNKRA